MFLAIVILKSLIELSLMFVVGRFILGLLAGAKRQTNVFWQLLDVASKHVLFEGETFSNFDPSQRNSHFPSDLLS